MGSAPTGSLRAQLNTWFRGKLVGLVFGSNARLSPTSGNVQFKNPTTGKWYDPWATGSEGAVSMAMTQDGEA